MADGAVYDQTGTILESIVKIDTVNFQVPASVIEIKGNDTFSSAFNPCASNIKSVTFQTNSNLQKVGKLLFSETSLQSIDMSPCTKLTHISDALFFMCFNLVSVKLPPNLEEIPKGAFSKCVSLPTLDIPDSVAIIGEWCYEYLGVFCETTLLTSVTIRSTSKLSTLGSHCFMKSGIKSIYLPKTLETIGASPFIYSSLERIDIDGNNQKYKTDSGHCVIINNNKIITVAPSFSGEFTIPEAAEFGEQAFRGSHISKFKFVGNKNYILSTFCFADTFADTISLPNLVEIIPSCCFWESKITTITLPTSTKAIYYSAFVSCTELTTVILPDSLEEMYDYVFANCSNLQQITIPPKVHIYGQSIFSNCSSNLVITFNNANFVTQPNGLVIFKNERVVEFQGKNSESVIEIPANTNLIEVGLFFGKKLKKITFATENYPIDFGKQAFLGSTIQEISFPSGLKSIGVDCFQDCKLLKTVFIAGSIDSISPYCFNRCEYLNSVTFRTNTVRSIKTAAFNGTKALKSIDLSNIVSIEEEAFQYSGLQIINLPSTATTLGSSTFRQSSVGTFKSTDSNIEEFPPYLLYNSSSLHTVELGAKIKKIGIHCFEGCALLESVKLSPATEVISMYAFSLCKELSYITIPKNSLLNKIEPFAFENSMNFKSFIIEDTEKFSFKYGCLMDSKQTKIIFYIPVNPTKLFIVPGTVQKIDVYAFLHCHYLREVIISGGVIKVIGAAAFEGCINLKRIVIPDSLETIGISAFKGCNKLECGSVVISPNKALIDQARKAGINEGALHDHCINNENYVQYGKYTCNETFVFNGFFSLLLIMFLF